jgi:hypothetical protein
MDDGTATASTPGDSPAKVPTRRASIVKITVSAQQTTETVLVHKCTWRVLVRRRAACLRRGSKNKECDGTCSGNC